MSRTELALGQTVITKHKNLRYYSSRVTQVMAQTFYEVMFDDGSFSNDTYPEDIVVSLLVNTRRTTSWNIQLFDTYITNTEF